MKNFNTTNRLLMTKRFFSSSVAALLTVASIVSAGAVHAQAETLNIDQVLRAANAAATRDRNAEAARENKFKSTRNREQGKLTSMRNERARQERISDQLDAQFNVNETKIEELQVELSKELGDLKELFGVIQTTASEAQENYKTSLISAQYPQRSEDLRQMVEKMSSLTELVSINEIEGLWVEMQNEMTEQSKIVSFNAPLNFVTGYEAKEDGTADRSKPIYEPQDRTITRVGVFGAVSQNDIASYKNDVGLVALDRQMRGSFSSKSADLQNSKQGVTSFLLDPTKGALLTAFVRKPTLWEKVQEGGVVGYVIIILGAIAALIAILRLFVLMGVEGSVNKQARDLKRPSLKNPLGRILKVYQDNPSSDPESMELKLGEAMLKESPKINAWVMFIKIIAVVAPLLGLLGTVTGMIQTFQAITLYGAGDPQTMAGGISQALVTTVLGLVVAIPTVFLHWVVSSRARRIEGALEEHATSLIADQYEGYK